MSLPKWLENKEEPRDKAMRQEKSLAKQYNARRTFGSGNQVHDKADVCMQKAKTQFEPKTLRVECKRTDAQSIRFEKAWVEKLVRETGAKEFWAMELEIQDTQIYVISKAEFQFLQWMLTTPVEQIVQVYKEAQDYEHV